MDELHESLEAASLVDELLPDGTRLAEDVGDGGGRPELGTTPIPVRPPDKTLARPAPIVK